MDLTVGAGDGVEIAGHGATVYETPGHTSGHISIHIPDSRALFCGDTLFALGCGRMFEGTPAQFWASLSTLRGLPGDTRIYCGHEYTQRSEEHTSELQSLMRISYAVFCLKKKTRTDTHT